MHTLWDEQDRRRLLDRLARLTPDHPAHWGRMNAPQMVTHLSESMRMALGDLPCKPKNVPWRHTPIKQLVVYWLPWPRGAPTARELIARQPDGDWAATVDELRTLVDRLVRRDPRDPWPQHPAFGTLSTRGWGVLGYRHMDHHLRQFGV